MWKVAISLMVALVCFLLYMETIVNLEARCIGSTDVIRARNCIRQSHDSITWSTPTLSPIIIGGCGHSGTSFLVKTLNRSRSICCHWDEMELWPHGGDTKWRTMLNLCTKKQHVLEKTPLNIRSVGKIFQDLPTAKIILMIRDGRDVAFSLAKREGNGTDCKKVRQGAKRWVEDNKAGLVYGTCTNVTYLRYETFVRQPRHSLQRLFTFIGVEMDSNVDFFPLASNDMTKPPSETGKNHALYRTYQVEGPIFDGSGKWKRSGISETCWQELYYDVDLGFASMLHILGYASTGGWWKNY